MCNSCSRRRNIGNLSFIVLLILVFVVGSLSSTLYKNEYILFATLLMFIWGVALFRIGSSR
jgi:hypothetical protein